MITSYNDMSVEMYLRLLAAAQDPDANQDEGDLPLLAIISGKTVDELLHLPFPEYLRIKEAGAFLAEQPAPAKVRTRYEVGPFVCTVPDRVDDLTAGQYIDLKEWGKLEHDGPDRTVEIIATILTPEGHAYNDGYSLEALRETIRTQMSVTDAVALRENFIKAWAHSTLAILRSSERRMPLRTRLATRKARKAAAAGLRGLIASGAGPGGRILSLTLPALLGTKRSAGPAPSSSASSATTSTSAAGRPSSAKPSSGAREGAADE